MWNRIVASPAVRLSSRHGCLLQQIRQNTRPYSWQEYPRQESRKITVYEGMQLSELAKNLRVTPSDLCRHPELKVEQLDAQSRLSMELAELAVISYGHFAHFPRVRDPLRMTARNSHHLQRCAPVVTVMGHVDHGKTSLLDALRKTTVAEGEAGGITQHIGAFSVKMVSGDFITFLDTPGHAAFSAMRARGASVTDIVVLVVAADDGVKPQTKECIELIKQANVPLVVAINKCDKHTANVEKVKHQLLQNGIQLEHFGGDIQAVEISAIKGTGLVQLEEAILAQAEISELKADYTGRVEGVVLEVRTDRGLGSVATVLVQHGQLKRGQVLVAGEVWAKIRTLLNDSGKRLNEAGPSMPVLTAGWRELPAVGELCLQMKDELGVRHVIGQRVFLRKKKEEVTRRGVTVHRNETEKKPLVPLIVKGDVAGSIEALLNIINAKQPEEIDLDVVHSGVGAISDSDIDAANAVSGVVLAFNVSAIKTAALLAKQHQITILSHKVIYKLLEELKDYLERRLPQVEEEEIVGEAAVIRTFKLTGAKSAFVGGCRVKEGELARDAVFKLFRDDEVVHEGKLSGMKRDKEDISTAKKETECGISFAANRIRFQEGDWVQCVRRNTISPTLHWDLGF